MDKLYPAFARPAAVAADGQVIAHGQAGMALRDWFAGQALAALAGNDWIKQPDVIAHRCYLIADAMLKERKEAT